MFICKKCAKSSEYRALLIWSPMFAGESGAVPAHTFVATGSVGGAVVWRGVVTTPVVAAITLVVVDITTSREFATVVVIELLVATDVTKVVVVAVPLSSNISDGRVVGVRTFVLVLVAELLVCTPDSAGSANR